MNKEKFTVAFVLMLFSIIGISQPRGPFFQSPEVGDDNSVTFRYFAPDANEVLLHGEFLSGPQAMTKDTSGIWEITISDIKPDIYPYFFEHDGVKLSDPVNTYVFANERFKRSLLEVTGPEPLIHSMQKVPHGKIHYQYYYSETLGRHRPLLVYTPPGYEDFGDKKYPVLYLIHGGSDTEETWTKVGRAHLIADNLIAQGKAEPMLIVMPYGNVRPNDWADFTKDVIDDIIPYVESNYPVLAEKDNRAVAGFSVGGGQTLNIGFTNLDKFGYICSYAPYTNTPEFKKNFTDWNPDATAVNAGLKLFTISVGTDDFLYESVRGNIKMFQEKSIDLKPIIVDGGHTWMNCKLFLASSLQALFK